MNLNIKFPLTINNKVYNSFDEIPEEFKKLINSSQFTNLESNITSKKEWNINGVTYTNFEEIPEDFKKYLEDLDNNGMPDFIEEKNSTINTHNVSKPVKLKETPLEEFYSESQNKKEQGIRPIYIFVALMILIIIMLAGYILMSGKH